MTDIQELFNRDPLSLTKQDRATITADLRKRRHNLNQAAIPAKSPAKQTKTQKLNDALRGQVEVKI
jgi:hypothetical protein